MKTVIRLLLFFREKLIEQLPSLRENNFTHPDCHWELPSVVAAASAGAVWKSLLISFHHPRFPSHSRPSHW